MMTPPSVRVSMRFDLMQRRFVRISASCCVGLAGATALGAGVDYDVGVGLAGTYVQARENLVAPLKFAGPSAAVTTTLAGRSETSEVEARVHVMPVRLRDRYDSENWGFSGGFDGRWRLDVRHGDRAVMRLGVMLDFHSWVGYFRAWDEVHAYWLSVIAAGPSLQVVARAPGDRDWSVDLEVPVVAAVARPPRYRADIADDLIDFGYWVSRIADGPRVTSVHELQAGRFRLTWRGRGSGFRVDPWGGFEFESFTEPEWVARLTYWLGVEARWGL